MMPAGLTETRWLPPPLTLEAMLTPETRRRRSPGAEEMANAATAERLVNLWFLL